MDQHKQKKLKKIIKKFSKNDNLLPIFLSPETHNSKRTAQRANVDYAKVCYLMNLLLPGIRFIHSGFELSEQTPVNTGLGFSSTELEQYPPEALPLFSALSLNWTNNELLLYMIASARELKSYSLLHKNTSMSAIKTNHKKIICFTRQTEENNILLLFLGNMGKENVELDISTLFTILDMKNIINELHIEHTCSQLRGIIPPYTAAIFEVKL